MRLDESSVEDLNLALRHYRRVLLFLFAAPVPAIAALVGLSHLGTWLAPPYGLRLLGWDLVTWGLIALLGLIFAGFWWQGRQIGRALNDPELMSAPIGALMSGLGVIAERANSMGMKWGPFFGPLRPVQRRPAR